MFDEMAAVALALMLALPHDLNERRHNTRCKSHPSSSVASD